jgi:single-strand DNA-binding protein
MAKDLNRVTLTCRLTRDPELRHTPSGTAVAKLRVAFTTRAKDEGGEWGEKSNFIDVTVFGQQGETAATYLEKGRRIGVDGRLEFDEWEGQDGTKRSKHEIIADTVAFLDSRGDREQQDFAEPAVGQAASPEDLSGGKYSDDDIPF